MNDLQRHLLRDYKAGAYAYLIDEIEDFGGVGPERADYLIREANTLLAYMWRCCQHDDKDMAMRRLDTAMHFMNEAKDIIGRHG